MSCTDGNAGKVVALITDPVAPALTHIAVERGPDVEGLVVDDEGHITYVLLQEGHFWGKKEVAIPIDSLEKIDAGGIHVRLSRHEIKDLPTLGVDPPGRREAARPRVRGRE